MALTSSAIASKTINVPADSRTIRSAIDIAEPGDTILIAPGTYREDIETNKEIILQGSGREVTILMGAVVIKNADGFTIDGFTLDGQGDDNSHRGIWCSFSTVSISNNSIIRYHHGITSESSRTTIENNEILDNFNAGIEIKTAIAASISKTIVADNTDTGILIALSEDNVLITNSIISGNRLGIDCVQCDPVIRQSEIKENKLGVKATQQAEPNLGEDSDPGLNSIIDNEVQIMNSERRVTIQAKGNYWGKVTGPDAANFDGKVDYAPWLESNPLYAKAVKSMKKLKTVWGKLKILK